MRIRLIYFLLVGFILVAIFLSGCTFASKSILDVNDHIGELKAGGLSSDCIAGFFGGIAVNTDNVKIKNAVGELEKLSSPETPDYKRCRAIGLETNILTIAGKEGLDDVVQKAMKLGLVP